MTRVLRIINRFNLGGPTFNAAYLSRYLPEPFETMLVGGIKDESEDSSEFILDNLGLEPKIIDSMRREVNFKNDREAYRQIKQLINEYKPDIVHTHASKAGAIGRLAASKMKVPVIVHTFHGHVFHSYFGKTKTNIYKNVERYLAKKSTRIVAISDIQKKELVEEHKICGPDKVEVIPLGFDLTRFREDYEAKRKAFRDEFGFREDEIVISIIGRLVPIKNHEMFLRSVKDVLRKTKQKVRFVIVGDGESREALFQQCQDMNILFEYMPKTKPKTPLIFTSWRKDIDVINAGSDIIVLTSKNEGTPVSLIEAQAANNPIVSTRVGGIENVVIEGETALLCDVGQQELFTTHLLSLIENEDLRQKMSKRGWEHVGKNFHYTRLVKDVENLYRKLLN